MGSLALSRLRMRGCRPPAATVPAGVAANSGFDPPLRGEKAFYVTALRTFSRNALSKPQGSQAHITGEREQASVTCC